MLHLIAAPQTKLVVADADNTLWGGVCGETASCDLLLAPRHMALQNHLLEQAKLGRLICLCSHNNPEDIERVFKERPDMPLRLEDFSGLRIGWAPKTELMSSLLVDFQAAPESVVLLDDDPLQCAQVRAEWPQMATLVWPDSDIEARRALQHFWRLDAPRQTAADSVRSEFFRADSARQQMLREMTSPEELLQKFELKIDVFPLKAGDLDRSAQLTARTTQFNFSPVRLNSAQIERLQQSECWAGVRVSDRFGDYGQVGLMGARRDGDTLRLHTFLLSCRALSRGVEYQMAAWVGMCAAEHGLSRCLIEWRVTERNYPARAFLDQIKDQLCLVEERGGAWLVPSQALSVIRPRWAGRVAIPPAGRILEANVASESAVREPPDWQRLVMELSTAAAVKEALAPTKLPAIAELTAMSPVEQALGEIWEEVLGVAELDVRADFFSLGGHSLLATKVMARIRDVFGVELGLEVLFEAPTITELCRLIVAEQLASQTGNGTRSHGPLADPEVLAPLASAQERFLVLEEYYEAPGLGNVPLKLRLNGVLDAAALAQSLYLLAVRHEALRARLVRKDGELWQVLGEPAPVRLGRSDLTLLPTAEQQRKIEVLARDEAKRPFDPEVDQLIRAHLIELQENDHVLLVTIHHSVLDATSQNILMDDLGVTYTALVANEHLQLQPSRPSFRAFAVWERAPDRQQRWHEHRHYWRNQLRGAQPPFADSSDQPTPDSVTSYRFQVHETLVEGIKAVAARARTTEFVVCLTAFSLALSDLTGRSDMVIGTPMSVRALTDFENLVGCFLNTLPIRINGVGELNLGALLTQVSKTTMEALARAEFPLEQILAAQAVRPNRDLIQTIFQLRPEALRPPKMPGLSTCFLPSLPPFARLPLSFALSPNDRGLQAVLEFASHRFDPKWIERLAGRYLVGLQRLINANAKAPALSARGSSARPGSAQRPLLFPPSKAVSARCGHLSISYDQLHDYSEALAGALRQAGLGPGARVGLVMERSIELVVGLIACLKARVTFVILDPRYPRARLDFMVADSDLALILTTATAALDFPPDGAATILDANRWSIDALSIKKTSVSDGTAAYIYYTSGSTGNPKGVLCARSGLDNLVNWFVDEFDLGADDGAFVATSPSFDLTLKNLLAPLLVGGSITLFDGPDYDVEALLKALVESPATWMNTTPTTLDLILREASMTGYAALRKLRYFFSGGETLKLDRLRDWAVSPTFEAQIVNTYGPTECTGIAGIGRVSAGPWSAGQIAPVRTKVGNVSLAVLTRGLDPTPVGEVGEVYIGGIAVGLGYWKRPRETAKKFLPDPERPGERRYRTGDLARVLPGGDIEVVGRSDLQVKIRGHRIELGEVEVALTSHPDVEEAAGFTVETETGTELRMAYVAGSGATPQPSTLRAHLGSILAAAAVPTVLFQIDRLPRTPSGKLDRLALAQGLNVEDSAEAEHATLTCLEHELAQLWTRVLKTVVASAEDDFFALGGHSLLASRLVHLVRKELKIPISIRTVFDHSTLAAMAAAIEERRNAQPVHQMSVSHDRSG